MGELIFEIISFVGAVASLGGLAYEFQPTSVPLTPLEVSLVVIAVVLTLIWACWRVVRYRRTAPVVCKNEKQIHKFMRDWIGRDGNAVIFTRDMSWAHNPETEAVLYQKAARHELTIVLDREIPLAQKLRNAGAKIVAYSDLRYTPSARFTIIKHGHHDAQVAVGGTIGDRHVINIFQQGHDVFFAVANDLVNVLSAYQNHRNVA